MVDVSVTVWERADESVLGWVASLASVRGRWDFTIRPEPPLSGVVDGLDDREMHEALLRLLSHGLVDGRHMGTSRFEIWTGLRVTAAGLIVLGEWPDLDRVVSATAIRGVLLHMADAAPESEQDALRRTGGFVARMGDAVRDALGELASDATKDVLE